MTKATHDDVFKELFNTPFFRSTVGFDRMYEDVINRFSCAGQKTYPPYNIKKSVSNDRQTTTTYEIEVAVAGFSRDELNVEVNRGVLTISGSVQHTEAEPQYEYMYHGIARRPFSHSFKLANDVEVNSVKMDNGLLTIKLVQVIPEELLPRQLTIE